MPSHVLTDAEKADGQRTSKTAAKERIKIARMNARTEKMKALAMREAAWFGLAGKLISNPAVVGTSLYLLVGWLEASSLTTKAAASAAGSASNPPIATTLPQWLESAIGAALNINAPGGLPVKPSQAVSSVVDQLQQIGADIGWAALKTALLAYIASGGNLAGVLASGSNILSTLPGIIGSLGA